MLRSVVGTEINNEQFWHKVISQSQLGLCWNQVWSSSNPRGIKKQKITSLLTSEWLFSRKRRVGGRQAQSNFLKSSLFFIFLSCISRLTGDIYISVSEEKKCLFVPPYVHNFMSFSTFGHFETLLLSSCGFWTLNWFWTTSTLQIAHKRHIADKRNIRMITTGSSNLYQRILWIKHEDKRKNLYQRILCLYCAATY